MFTYSYTVATQDDTGTVHRSREQACHEIDVLLSNAGAIVFTNATGYGYDSETDEREPVVILQGTAPDEDTLATIDQLVRDYARATLRQRAVGRFVLPATVQTYAPVASPVVPPAAVLTYEEAGELVAACDVVLDWKAGVWSDRTIRRYRHLARRLAEAAGASTFWYDDTDATDTDTDDFRLAPPA